MFEGPGCWKHGSYGRNWPKLFKDFETHLLLLCKYKGNVFTLATNSGKLKKNFDPGREIERECVEGENEKRVMVMMMMMMRGGEREIDI